MLEILLPYFPSFARGFGFLVFLPLSTFGLGIFSKISFSALLSALIGPFPEWHTAEILTNLFVGILIASPLILLIEIGKGFVELLCAVSGINFSSLYYSQEATERNLITNFFNLACFATFVQSHMLNCMNFMLTKNFELDFRILFDLGVIIFKQLSQFFLPILIVFVVTEISLGLFQRVLPSFSITFEIQAIKILFLLTIVVCMFTDVGELERSINLENLIESLKLIVRPESIR